MRVIERRAVGGTRHATQVAILLVSWFVLTAGCVAAEGSAAPSPGDNAGDAGGENPDATDAEVDSGAGGSGGDVGGIQYYGRWDFSDPENPSASWGSVYLEARFEGTSVGIRLDDPNNDFQYRIDDGPLIGLSPTSASEYPLAAGLADGAHTLAVYRRTAGGWGRTELNGLTLDMGKTLLAPPPRPTRKIEIIGHSISVGFGNEGSGGTSRSSENGYMAFGPQLARMFGAEWSVVGHSGQGLFRNLNEPLPPTQKHMPDEFRLTHFPVWPGQPNTPWDFDSWQPDALLIALGTNDFSGADPFPSATEFGAAYSEFLTFLRGAYPDAELFCVGTFAYNWGTPAQFDDCNRYICAVVAAKNAQGDDRIHCVDPGAGPDGNGHWLPNSSDYINDWTHPTVAGHTIIAENLHAIMQPVLGW